MTSKYQALPKGVSENRFDAAIKKFQAALGADQVLTSADHLRPYTKVMMSVPDARHQPSAVVTATSVEQTDTFLVTITDGYGGSAAVPVSTVKVLAALRLPAASTTEALTTWVPAVFRAAGQGSVHWLPCHTKPARGSVET